MPKCLAKGKSSHLIILEEEDVTIPLKLDGIISYSIGSTSSERKGASANDSMLAKTWAIGQSIARETLRSTTQNFIKSALYPIEHCFWPKQVMLKYNRLNCKFYSDTFSSDKISVSGNKCCQLSVSEFRFV